MTIYYSPLRYPGGKGKIAKFFYAVFEENKLLDGTYVEPYAGGASIALSLLFNEYASNIVINDIDRSIYAFWRSVLYRNDELCRLIEKTKVNMKIWRQCKLIQKKKRSAKILDLGFSTFFLNRTNRSGIINAGVIGGKKQDGEWKMNARFNKEDLLYRIRRIGEYRDRVKVYNLDACKLLEKISPSFTTKTLVYFDPPYYEKGKELYVNYYKNNDHQHIAKKIKRIKKAQWIVSYDNKKEIKAMYSGCNQIKYMLNYSAATISKASEIMFSCKGLNLSKKTIVVLPNGKASE